MWFLLSADEAVFEVLEGQLAASRFRHRPWSGIA
jgi:hypothetical protein